MRSRLLVAFGILVAACGSGAVQTTSTASLEITTSIEQTAPTQATTTTVVASTTTEPVLLIRIESGEKVEGPDTISVSQGESVTFAVVTDVVDEVHVHGYDLFFATTPSKPVLIEFVAEAAGIFEVELEGAHLDLVSIEVTA